MTEACSVENCGRTVKARSYCTRHLARFYKGKSLSAEEATFLDRFWAFVDIDEDGCWIWKGPVAGRYGQIRFLGHPFPAHRVAFEIYVAGIPTTSMVCHRCDTPLCVRPDHLFLGSRQDNMDDMKAKRRHRGPFKIGSPEWRALEIKQE